MFCNKCFLRSDLDAEECKSGLLRDQVSKLQQELKSFKQEIHCFEKDRESLLLHTSNLRKEKDKVKDLQRQLEEKEIEIQQLVDSEENLKEELEQYNLQIKKAREVVQ